VGAAAPTLRDLRKQLVETIRGGTPAQVEALLERHPGLADARNAHGNTPVREAIGVRRAEMVALLLDRGADPLQVNHGGSSLMDAATAAGCRACAALLVARGCRLRTGDAAGLGLLRELRALLAASPAAAGERDRVGGAPLHAAARGDQPAAVRLLLDRGADIAAVNRHGHPPLADAVEAGALAAGAVLLARGADPCCPAGHFGGTALHRAIANRHQEMARLLLAHGADPSRQDSAGKTALHDAVIAGTAAWVELILTYRPDLNLRTRPGPTQPGGETALDYARRRRKPALIRLLEAAREAAR
jgi:ankyrin repeat protein